jgi:hypothetical protein
MIGHPDADTLAACREGLLGGRRSARIRAHLARCSRCASLDRELAAVTTQLASAPLPRIPDELAARLDTVLAAESAARARRESPATDGIPTADGIPATDGIPTADGRPATAGVRAGPHGGQSGPAGGQSGPGSGAGPRPDRPRSARPPRPWRVTALRAASVTAVLLVIAGGGYGVSRLLQGGNSSATSSASNGAARSSGVGPRANAPMAGGNSGTGSSRAGLAIPGGDVGVVHSGTDYQPGRLAAQAQAVLDSHPAQAAGHAPSFGSASGITTTGCVKQFAGAGPPTLVDEASYGGQPATIIIRAPAAHRPGHVWVVVPSCSAASRQVVQTAALPAPG